MKSKNKGFTLLELLAVLVILAALAAIAIPIFGNKSDVAKQRAHEMNRKMLRQKGLEYVMTKGDGLVGGINIIDSMITDGYIKEKPTNPITGNKDYRVIYKSTGGVEVLDSISANEPKLAAGMTPVKFNGSAWVKAAADNTDGWYNYQGDISNFETNKADERWANVMLGDGCNGNTTFNGSMFVWIPRYTYDIKKSGASSQIWIKYSDGIIDDTSVNPYNGTSQFKAHPAFWWDNDNDGVHDTGEELTGIWVAKFEASAINGQTGASGDKVQVKPGAKTWVSRSVNEGYSSSRAMQNAGNPYGLSTDTNVVDAHMIKDVEWGAIAYLTEAIRDGVELGINNYNGYYTGHGALTTETGNTVTGTLRAYTTTDSMRASTTGNVYGVYDMSGGAWEFTAGYTGTGNGNTSNLTIAKYRNILSTATGTAQVNYDNTKALTIGWGLQEIADSYTGANSFRGYGDSQEFVWGAGQAFQRGGNYGTGNAAGLFCFTPCGAEASAHQTFRPTIVNVQ